MIDIELDDLSGIAIVQPEGPLDADDFQLIAETIDPYIESSGVLTGLIIQVKKFPGWEDLEAMTSHFRLVHDHHKKIKKVALVTDAPFLSFMSKLMDHSVTAEVKSFEYEQLEMAHQWVVE